MYCTFDHKILCTVHKVMETNTKTMNTYKHAPFLRRYPSAGTPGLIMSWQTCYWVLKVQTTHWQSLTWMQGISPRENVSLSETVPLVFSPRQKSPLHYYPHRTSEMDASGMGMGPHTTQVAQQPMLTYNFPHSHNFYSLDQLSKIFDWWLVLFPLAKTESAFILHTYQEPIYAWSCFGDFLHTVEAVKSFS